MTDPLFAPGQLVQTGTDAPLKIVGGPITGPGRPRWDVVTSRGEKFSACEDVLSPYAGSPRPPLPAHPLLAWWLNTTPEDREAFLRAIGGGVVSGAGGAGSMWEVRTPCRGESP